MHAAPPSTLGVDATAHPECSDEPLFHNTPVPAEALYFLAIARRPETVLKHIKTAADGTGTDQSLLADPTVLADATHRPELAIPREVCARIDHLLVQESYVLSEHARTTRRFVEQTAARVQASSRAASSSALRLNSRHMSKRKNSQFFRSR